MDELEREIRDLGHLGDVPYEREMKLRSFLTGYLRERMTRRELLRIGGLSGLSVTALWALACQPGAPAATPTKAPVAAATPTKAPVAAATPTPALPTPTPKPKRPQILRTPSQEPKTLDGNLADAEGWGICKELYSTLIRMEPCSPKIVNDLAEAWDVSKDGLTYNFKLKKNAVWGGKYGKVTAQDVKASFERIQDPATKSLWLSNAKPIVKMETPDENTFILTLNEPFYAFRQFLLNKMGWLTCVRAVKEMGVEAYGRKPISSGPFFLDQWVTRQEMVFVRNDKFYDGPPKLEKVVLKIIYELATQQMAFRAGDLDYISLQTGEDYLNFQKDPKFGVYMVGPVATMVLHLNPRVPPLDNMDFRFALAHAVNKEDHVAGYAGLVEKANTIVPRTFFGHDPSLPDIPFDMAKAKERLAKSGVKTPVEWVHTSHTDRRVVSQIQQARWKELGVNIKIDEIDTPTWMQRLRGGGAITWFDSFTRPPDADPFLWDKLHGSMFTEGKVPWFQYEKTDKWLVEGRREMDETKRKAIYAQIDRFLNTETAQWLPIFYRFLWATHQKSLKGFCANPEHGLPWRNMWLED